MVPKSLFTSFPLSENHLLNRLCAFTSTSYRNRQRFPRHGRYKSEQFEEGKNYFSQVHAGPIH
jgi:hypothetical protein